MRTVCAAVVAGLVVAGCTQGGASVASSSPFPTPSASLPPTEVPVVVPSPSPPLVEASPPPRLLIPAPTLPFVRCDTPSLEMRLITMAAAAGNIGGVVEVRNKSTRNCDLYGYAGLALLDSSGKPIPSARVTWSTNTFFYPDPINPTIVGLPAGTPPLTPSKPIPGHAYIDLSWNDVLDPCVSPSELQLTPPDATTSIFISSIPSGYSNPIYVCSGGSIIVNPVRPARY